MQRRRHILRRVMAGAMLIVSIEGGLLMKNPLLATIMSAGLLVGPVIFCIGLAPKPAEAEPAPAMVTKSKTPQHASRYRSSGRRRARNIAIGGAGGAAAGALIGGGRGARAGAVVGGASGG